MITLIHEGKNPRSSSRHNYTPSQVLLVECTSQQNNWNAHQTDVNITLQAGQMYYVEFVGVMWNFGQDFGVGMTKKTTPYQTYDVDISKKEYPYWYWKQSYSDEIQVRVARLVERENY